MTTTVALARRTGQVGAAFTPVLPLVAGMGTDAHRRYRTGRRAARSAVHLGGLFLWTAEQIVLVPTLVGMDLAQGVIDELSASPASVPTVDTVASFERLDVDQKVFGALARLLRPFTGFLSGATVDGLARVVRDQAAAECSVDEECRWRAALGYEGLVVAPGSSELISRREGRPDSPRLEDEQVAVRKAAVATLLSWWAATAFERSHVPGVVDQRLYRLPDGRFGLERAAGAVELDDRHRDAIAELASGRGPTPALRALLTEELGRGDTREISDAVCELAWGTDDAALPGPISLLRALDRAVREHGSPPTFHRATLVLVRQLLVFRAMRAEVGRAAPLFPLERGS